ncbi:MAG: SEC-C domain-containing protein [Kangiellaceae bacterium]|nr:SEC-C domain-containing protein [Kangiellaceae bacterium]
MSKFFFDGKANNNSERGKRVVGGGERVLKLGSKKSPAQISVHTAARKTEVEAIISKNKWFASITVDSDLPENVKDLEFLQERQVVSVSKSTTGRNEPCPCGSGKKFKKCCA